MIIRAPAIGALALLVGCAREPQSEAERKLEILAAHRDPKLEPEGDWSLDGGEFPWTALHIVRLNSKGLFQVRIVSGSDVGDREIPGTGRLADGVLTLTADTAGDREFDDRLHVCRFGSRELLLSEKHAWFTRGEEPVPGSGFYTRSLPQSLRGYLPGPDDENTPAPWRDGEPGEGQ